jgi:hypothetical protein
VVDSVTSGDVAPTAAVVDSVTSGDVAPVAVVDSVTSGDVAPVAVVEQCSRKRLLDTGSTQVFGKLCRRICTFLSKPPALLLVSGPTGCGKLTAAQHCVAHSAFGLVEIVNESAAATGIIQAIRRSGSMLTSTTNVGPSVIVVTGADGVQSGMTELLSCIRQCKKHVIILVNSMVAFTTALGNEVFRCNWSKPWSYDALRATMDAVPGSDTLTTQEKGVMTRGCNDLRQLRIATELLVNAKRCDIDVPSVMFALCDNPAHQWFNTLDIVKGKQLPTEHHNIGWLGGSYLGGLQSTALEGAADFASNLVVADMLQQSGGCEFGNDYSALVLQSSMPLVSHVSGLQIEKIRMDMPRPNKRARYSPTLQIDV